MRCDAQDGYSWTEDVGSRRLSDHGKSSSVECKKDFRREFNSFDLFIEQLIVFISSAKVSSYKVGTFYKNFCADNALILLADNV